MEQRRAAAPDPHTLDGERRPDRASAIPSSSFCLILSFVTADPNTKYRHTMVYPFQPNAANTKVPSSQELATPAGVSPFNKIRMPVANTRLLARPPTSKPGASSASKFCTVCRSSPARQHTALLDVLLL
eukprot:scaffold285_cov330-Pavlova_lutheri.AAC.8